MTKKLVAYFSVGGVTKNVAEQVAKQVGANLYEIRPMNPYSKRDLDYLDPMSRSTMEAAKPKARPALADRDARVEDYDVVYVGFPIWWGLAPKLINRFLEAYDFRGKTVVPFATSSGSGIGDVSKYIAPSAPGATVTEGQLLNGETVKIADPAEKTFYDFSVKDGEGKDVPMANFKGKVVIVVNTATRCGFTPHYKPLEEMYAKYHADGLEILDIPCNQFGAQAPGTDAEIHEFCVLNYKTEFPQMKKSDVNGENELPLYTFLKSKKGFEGFPKGQFSDGMDKMLSKADPDYAKKTDIKWNFTKFVVNRDGEVVKRFEPTANMADVEKFVKELL